MIAQHLLAKRNNNVEHGSTGKFRLSGAPVYCKPRTSQTDWGERGRGRTSHSPCEYWRSRCSIWHRSTAV